VTGRLAGKVALINGAGSVGAGWGNGRAEAVIFAREGASLFLVDRDADALAATMELLAEEGGTARTCVADVTSSEAVAAFVADCVAELGTIDVLVNNVGGSRHGGVVELSQADWQSQLDTNLSTVFTACKYVVPVMRERGGGSIINTASASGMRWTGAAQVGYAAAKAAIIQLSKVTAVQYGPAATSRSCSRSARSASRSASWATGATRPTQRCSSRQTNHASSPVPRSSSMAG
jgi:NAD(P)-dependent dehydrogenase (short-subunit alcohol dehydrogenase family)